MALDAIARHVRYDAHSSGGSGEVQTLAVAPWPLADDLSAPLLHFSSAEPVMRGCNGGIGAGAKAAIRAAKKTHPRLAPCNAVEGAAWSLARNAQASGLLSDIAMLDHSLPQPYRARQNTSSEEDEL
jgi:hypothetical protein